MSKYIDADKLIAEIEKKKKILISEYNELVENGVWISAKENKIKIYTISDILSLITSLQQEKPEVDLKKEYKEYVEDDVVYSKENRYDEGCMDVCHRLLYLLDTIEAEETIWHSVKDEPLEVGVEVIGYNKKWIDEDFNPNGTRIGFLMDGVGFCSATWNSEQDCYDTVYEEGDDYYKGNAFVIEEEKKKALPNMPTHYMFIPKHPQHERETKVLH